jgi:hypothetical protein
MVDDDQLLKRARTGLALGPPGGPMDLTLWEHSLRVLASAEIIASMPEVAAGRIDRQAMKVAALYHDAGWAVQVTSGEIPVHAVLSRPTNDVQHELAAQLVEASLHAMLPPRTVEVAAGTIRGINNRRHDMIESHIISDADNLDQIGPIGLFHSLRRSALDGRGLRHLLDGWYRQQEYHYWEARIRDGIRFESVRELAWKRLAAMEPFMLALDDHLNSKDVAGVLQLIRAAALPEATLGSSTH